MVTTHNLGFPRIGARRELKFALEAYWRGETGAEALEQTALALRQRHWQQQQEKHLDLIPVGDFSLYDQVLDMSFTLGHVPPRARSEGGELDTYFRVARGQGANDGRQPVCAGEMTKWFDTNYHYIVPEFDRDTAFSLNKARLETQLAEARAQGINAKPVLIGPLTYLWLGKSRDHTGKLSLLDRLLPVYRELLDWLQEEGVQWVQVDEPILVTELDSQWQQAFRQAYKILGQGSPSLLLTTYFGPLADNLPLVCELPVQGIHLDCLRGREDLDYLVQHLRGDCVLSLGVIDGRNIWKADLAATLDWLEPVYRQLGERLWLAPSCSLLHVPVDLDSENKIGENKVGENKVEGRAGLDPEVGHWLAFALQKLDELNLLARALDKGRDALSGPLADNARALNSRWQSSRTRNPAVREAVSAIDNTLGRRQSGFSERRRIQAAALKLPAFPTTAIGSFPQTSEIRKARLCYRRGDLSKGEYQALIRREIEHCIRQQETLGLDVLVHGEAERNDMVEYFGEQLDGFAFSRFGWVQSYGSRCVKPPILFGDITRPHAMTLEWIRYARSLTDKPVKGMLTGPVTILNWSFVRDDQPCADTCYQLALAIREEVLALEQADVNIIQIDEAALREGLPLRRSQWQSYLHWAIGAFRIAANGVQDGTQIHTHMCYSDFNDIIQSIAEMDADVISIETSRSNMELLEAFEHFNYPNELGPGVYDIHSPNIPDSADMVALMEKAARRIPADRLWVNPDCGLKTRTWEEVVPALQNMVQAARQLRES